EFHNFYNDSFTVLKTVDELPTLFYKIELQFLDSLNWNLPQFNDDLEEWWSLIRNLAHNFLLCLNSSQQQQL
ncbi:hypothetical protein HK099_000271, partial [Clydaea vesicula]